MRRNTTEISCWMDFRPTALYGLRGSLEGFWGSLMAGESVVGWWASLILATEGGGEERRGGSRLEEGREEQS